MNTRRYLVFALCTGLFAAPEPDPPAIQVTGAVREALRLTSADLLRMPRSTVKTMNSGMETVYEGVQLYEVLKRAGVAQGKELRGKALTSYVLAEAQDGYQVLFSLAELDPTFLDNGVLLADTANGKPLFGVQGRFRLIAPKDGPGARSVRMLTRLEVVQVRK